MYDNAVKRYYNNSHMETTPLPLFLGLNSKIEEEIAQRLCSSHINSIKSTKKEDQKDIAVIGFFPNKQKKAQRNRTPLSEVLRSLVCFSTSFEISPQLLVSAPPVRQWEQRHSATYLHAYKSLLSLIRQYRGNSCLKEAFLQ